MPTTASLDELKDFANKVREAGGGKPLDALMPAVPSDQYMCLIAKNLNCKCNVTAEGPNGEWIMVLKDKTTRDNIAKALKLKAWDRQCGTAYAVILPERIGRIAEEFDSALAPITGMYRYASIDKSNRKALNRLKRFWPYLDASSKNQFIGASFMDTRGELVL